MSNEKLRKNSKSSLKQHLNQTHKSLTAINTITSPEVSPNMAAKMEAIEEMAKDNETGDKSDIIESKFELLAKYISFSIEKQIRI